MIGYLPLCFAAGLSAGVVVAAMCLSAGRKDREMEADRETLPLPPPARCLVCGESVRHLAESGRVGLFDYRDGRLVPHRCPDSSVAGWIFEHAYRRLCRRWNRVNAAPIHRDDAALCQLDYNQSPKEI